MSARPPLAAGLAACLATCLALPPAAQAQIRNAPSPRALEFAAYIFAAANVCGYRIGTEEFDALLEKQNVRAADVSPRGPFGGRVQTMFALMSNQMQLNREQACIAVAGEYGPEGSISKNVLRPAPPAENPAAENPAAGAPPSEAKPAQ
ncbi:hypothetical protein ASF49_05885 [Methylobacterium sp. Leaf104]|uniref:hypothetical protein n=1 Tax=Methylobacterium TaxID=407 RepID=UPI0006FDE3FC|nr:MULTISPECIES: hypothetical protein [Methylobacterium]KQP38513.1 hypothetical protein ASF49_05885 [Methylobacterium sp. Leaf104]MCI9880057.1 hypothetical protein [Methylobacterium goesingense]